MALFNFPPFGANGSTGFLDPALAYQAQASLLGPQAQAQPQPTMPASPNRFGADNSIWSTLMGLGAGLAAGGAPGGGGWGAGIGKGLAGASELTNQQRELELKKQAYALQQATLEHQLSHDTAMEGIAQQGANTAELTRTGALDIRRADLAGPFNLIKATLPQYDEARKAAVEGRAQTVFGPSRAVLSNLIVGIAKATGQDQKTMLETMLPKWTDGQEERYSKIRMIDGAIATLGPIAAQNQIGTAQDFTVQPMAPPSSTVAPMGGPIRAGVAGEPPTQSIVGERVPEGVDPKLWAVMTPEEKALWQK